MTLYLVQVDLYGDLEDFIEEAFVGECYGLIVENWSGAYLDWAPAFHHFFFTTLTKKKVIKTLEFNADKVGSFILSHNRLMKQPQEGEDIERFVNELRGLICAKLPEERIDPKWESLSRNFTEKLLGLNSLEIFLYLDITEQLKKLGFWYQIYDLKIENLSLQHSDFAPSIRHTFLTTFTGEESEGILSEAGFEDLILVSSDGYKSGDRKDPRWRRLSKKL
jgi:hypothetical protein